MSQDTPARSDALIEAEIRRKGDTLKADVEQLSVPLTPSERLAYGEKAAALRVEAERIAAERKAAMDEAKSRIDQRNSQAAELERKIHARSEQVPVVVIVVANYEEHSADTYRADTGERISQRALTSEEQQRSMFGDTPTPPPKPRAVDDAFEGDDDDDDDTDPSNLLKLPRDR
jgi:hypothetical protein